jgi:hypothetical protein
MIWAVGMVPSQVFETDVPVGLVPRVLTPRYALGSLLSG